MKYRKLRKYKYQTVEPTQVEVPIIGLSIITKFITLTYDGRLCVRAGYAWDGPSGPTLDTRTFMRGSLAHDALYQLIREGLLPPEARRTADEILYRLCREDGMGWVRAQYVYRSVRLFGGLAAKPDETGQIIYEAP